VLRLVVQAPGQREPISALREALDRAVVAPPVAHLLAPLKVSQAVVTPQAAPRVALRRSVHLDMVAYP
jgi:hypothetical protein